MIKTEQYSETFTGIKNLTAKIVFENLERFHNFRKNPFTVFQRELVLLKVRNWKPFGWVEKKLRNTRDTLKDSRKVIENNLEAFSWVGNDLKETRRNYSSKIL